MSSASRARHTTSARGSTPDGAEPAVPTLPAPPLPADDEVPSVERAIDVRASGRAGPEVTIWQALAFTALAAAITTALLRWVRSAERLSDGWEP